MAPSRSYGRGEGDARGDFDRDYRAWYRGLFPSLAAALHLPEGLAPAQATGPRFSVSFVNKLAISPIIRSYSAIAMTVRANRELQRRDCERPSERSTRHLEIALPPGLSYSAGDHLGIVPRNGLDAIRRVLLRFKLDPSLYVTITPHANSDTYLPVNEPVPLLGVLANRIELQDIATRAQLATLAAHAKDSGERQRLLALAGDDEASQERYREEVFAPRKSVLDLLDEFPSCTPPFETFLDLMPPLRPRYYSISSSPLAAADACSITVGVLDAPALSGHGAFRGVCSNYLAAQPADATLYGFIRKPTIPFHPPENPHAPMIMVGPGTGVAPFRGFLQERAALKKQGAPIGPSLLFFGCRDPLQDVLYEEEMRGFEAAGVTRLICAFSREPGKPKTYVQQAIADHGEEVWRLLQREADRVRLRRGFAHGAGGSTGVHRPFRRTHRRFGPRREGLARRACGEPALSRGHLGVRHGVHISDALNVTGSGRTLTVRLHCHVVCYMLVCGIQSTRPGAVGPAGH